MFLFATPSQTKTNLSSRLADATKIQRLAKNYNSHMRQALIHVEDHLEGIMKFNFSPKLSGTGKFVPDNLNFSTNNGVQKC
jgi:bacterioferritin (cytochrome b1)